MLRSKSIIYVEEFLTSKNWELIDAGSANDSTLGYIDFAYKKSSFNNEAESFFSLLYFKSLKFYNRVSFQINSVTKYNEFMTRIKALGYKLDKSDVDEGRIIKVYKNIGITIRIKITTTKVFEKTETRYLFLICDSLDYSLNLNE